MPSANLLMFIRLLETISELNNGPIDLRFTIQFDSYDEVIQVVTMVQKFNLKNDLQVQITIMNQRLTFKVI